MRQTLPGVLLLLLCSSLSAQVRVDLGLAAGQQAYEADDLDSRFLISPEVLLSRERLAFYYSLDLADLSSGGTMYGNHYGLAYRWPVGQNGAFRAGAGPSYVSVEHLGGEPTWHAQVELALRTRRLEWFAKLRHYDYSLSEFRVADASPNGPALLAGVRITLRE